MTASKSKEKGYMVVMSVVVVKMVYVFCWVDLEIRGACGVNIM